MHTHTHKCTSVTDSRADVSRQPSHTHSQADRTAGQADRQADRQAGRVLAVNFHQVHALLHPPFFPFLLLIPDDHRSPPDDGRASQSGRMLLPDMSARADRRAKSCCQLQQWTPCHTGSPGILDAHRRPHKHTACVTPPLIQRGSCSRCNGCCC